MYLRLAIKQVMHKWGMNLLFFLTMAALVSLYIFVLNTNSYTLRSMQLIMKRMGHNQFIVPADQSPYDTYLCTDNQKCFPEPIVTLLASHEELLSRYYVAVLQQRMEVEGLEVIMSGIMPVARADETSEKGNLMKSIKKGEARLGAAVAQRLGKKVGDSIEAGALKLTVKEILPLKGTLEDFRLYFNLGDMQGLVERPGLINLILSFECLHVGGSLKEIHEFQREAVKRVAPDYTQYNLSAIATGRYQARHVTDRYQYYLLAIVGIITLLIVMITGFQEVAERRYETGILIAQGTGYCKLISLYLMKTLIFLALATTIGFIAGGWVSVWLTKPILATQTRQVDIIWQNIWPTLGIVSAVGLAAQVLPMIKLVRMDPCAIVMEE